jgi:hypothetical protein
MWNINVAKEVASLGPAYYPELCSTVYILQAPWLAARAYALCAPLLPEKVHQPPSVRRPTGILNAQVCIWAGVGLSWTAADAGKGQHASDGGRAG